MKNLRLKNPINIFFSCLNINSVRNKFKNMSSLISENIEILIKAETKLDSSFPTKQFSIPGFHHPFQLDINRRSGGIISGRIISRKRTSLSVGALC